MNFYKIFFLFITLIIIISSCQIRNQEKYYAKAQEEYAPFDVIIVPGVPFPAVNDTVWSRNMKLRVYWAKHLWDNKMTKNIIFSGGAVYTKYLECTIMKLYAIEMGIPEDHIFLDSLAQHSTENVFYSGCVAKQLGFKNIALATDPFQGGTLRTFVKKMNRKTGANIQILPTIMDTITIIQKENYPIDYNSAIGTNFIDIENTQKIGYRLNGTLGRNIDWSIYDSTKLNQP